MALNGSESHVQCQLCVVERDGFPLLYTILQPRDIRVWRLCHRTPNTWSKCWVSHRSWLDVGAPAAVPPILSQRSVPWCSTWLLLGLVMNCLPARLVLHWQQSPSLLSWLDKGPGKNPNKEPMWTPTWKTLKHCQSKICKVKKNNELESLLNYTCDYTPSKGLVGWIFV